VVFLVRVLWSVVGFEVIYSLRHYGRCEVGGSSLLRNFGNQPPDEPQKP